MPTKSTTQKGGIEIFNLVIKFISGTETHSVIAGCSLGKFEFYSHLNPTLRPHFCSNPNVKI